MQTSTDASERTPAEHGVWYDPATTQDLGTCARRHAAAGAAARAWAAQCDDPARQALGIHAFLPPSSPRVGLWTRHAGLAHLVGTATLLRDAQGPCLVTAAHTLLDKRGRYTEALRDGGLMALAASGERLILGKRVWSDYGERDVAITALTEREAATLGGAVTIAYGVTPPALWVAFGYPCFANRQRHRAAPVVSNGTRLVLYHETQALGCTSARQAWKLDRRDVFDPVSGRQTEERSLRGCSGGLIAGYHPMLACWLPEAILTEYHQGERQVGTRLSAVFGALPTPPSVVGTA